MTETNVFELTQPGTFSDPLTEVLRNGARTLLGQAVEAEVAASMKRHGTEFAGVGNSEGLSSSRLPKITLRGGAREIEGEELFQRVLG